MAPFGTSKLYSILSTTQYDLSASQFSPDGRVFQVEYAQKAVENSGYVDRDLSPTACTDCYYSNSTVVALKGKDGVVLAVEKIVTSKLYEPGTNKRIFPIDRHISAAVAGLLADSRTIVERAREEASEYRVQYGMPIPLNVSSFA